MTNPTVSIIVPTYNRPHFLERALRTITAQTFRDFEIIVVNDAGSCVEDMVMKCDKAKLINHTVNKGLAASRNTGLRAAKGKYITFLDDDDVIFPVHFQVLVHELDKGTQAAYTDAYRWENEEYLRRTLFVEYSKERLYAGCTFYVMSVMLRREVFDGHWFDESLPSHEDYDMWLTLSEDNIDFVHLPFITAAYSQRGDGSQISHKPYHKGYYDKVRAKHNVDHIVPIWEQKPKDIIMRYRVLKSFTGRVLGVTRHLTQGKILDIESDVGSEYARAGYVERVE